MADIVGTAFVTVRALTSGVKRDIQRGIDKGVKDSEPSTKRAGERIGRHLGQGIETGLSKSTVRIGRSLATGLDKNADRDGAATGRKIGRAIGREVAFQVRRVPIAPFLIAGMAPVLAGGLKLIAAFVGSSISFLAPLGPAFTAATVSAGAGVTALGQAGLTMLLAWKAEGPVLDAFKERMTGIKEELFEVGKAVQGVLFKPLADSIERMTNNLLPALRDGLVGTGRVLAQVSIDFARLSGDPIFQGQFASILANNNVVLANFGRALVSLTSSAVTLVAAGGPLLTFFSRYVATTASGWADTLRLSQETNRLSGFFERAQGTLQQLGRIGENVRIALSGTFRSASTESEHLWGRFEILTEKWRAFTESVRGQRVLDRFFAESSAVTTEVSALFGDMFTLIGRGLTTSSGGLIGFIQAIRFEVLPAVAEMSRSFAGLAPVLTRTVVTIAQFFSTLAQTGVLSTFLNTLSLGLNVFETLLSLPVVGWVTGVALSFLALGKALNIITLGYFARALAPIGGLLGGIAGRTTAAALGVGQFTLAANRAGLALKGLGASLLGPLGLAITGVTLALGFLVGKHQDAKAAAAEQARVEQELAATLDTVTGAATRATREYIANELVTSGAAEAAKNFGISLQDVTDAASGNDEALGRVNDGLIDVVESAVRGSGSWELFGEGLEQSGISARDFAEAIVAAGGSIDDVSFTELLGESNSMINSTALLTEVSDSLGSEYDVLTGSVGLLSGELTDAQGAIISVAEATASADQRVIDFNAAMATLNDTSATTNERLDALDAALDALSPSATTVEETTGRLNEVLRDSATDLKNAEGGWLDMTGAIDASTGKINTATEGGFALFESLEAQSDAARDNALAIRDKAEADGTLAEAGPAILAPLQQAKDAFIAQAVAAGVSAEAAAAAWDVYAQAPELVATTIRAEGVEDATTGVLDYSAQLDAIDGRNAIAHLLGDNTVLADKLIASRGDLDAFDAIIAEAGLDADSAPAQAKYAEVVALLTDLDARVATPEAHLDPAILDRERTRIVNQLDVLGRMKPTPAVRAEISDFQAKKRTVDSNIAALNRAIASPTIRAVDQASGTIGLIRRLIDGIPRLVQVKVQVIGGTVTGGQIPEAEGGIVRKRAADGLLARRQPMIAKGGSNIIWAEPETEDESYIPHSPSKRRRATKVLNKTAQIFGYGLHQMAEGGLTGDQSLSAGSTGTNAGARGGDVYNINVDGPEVVARAQALAEAIETRRRRESALRGRIPR